MIYLDNAATTLQKPPCVMEAVVSAMSSLGNCGRGANPASLTAARAVYCARERVASLFGCKRASHVVFTANATESLNIALNGILSPGDHVITTDLEHNSVLRPLHRLERHGVALSFLPADGHGLVDTGLLPRLLRKNTKAVVCTHASNLTGTLVDLKAISAFARAHGLLLIADASQTAGARPIHMEDMGIDVLCFTGHKGLMGPQGTGGLCIREGVSVRPWKVGGTGVQSHLTAQPEQLPERLEAGTLNSHGIAGLSAAVDYILETGVERIAAHERMLMRRFHAKVREVDGVTVYGDFSADRAPIVALNIRDYASSAVADELALAYGVATRSGIHCAPRLHAALGTAEQGAVRFSFGWFNTEEDIDAAAAAVAELAKE